MGRLAAIHVLQSLLHLPTGVNISPSLLAGILQLYMKIQRSFLHLSLAVYPIEQNGCAPFHNVLTLHVWVKLSLLILGSYMRNDRHTRINMNRFLPTGRSCTLADDDRNPQGSSERPLSSYACSAVSLVTVLKITVHGIYSESLIGF